MSAVSVCIPTIPPRDKLLRRAFQSVQKQTRKPDEIIIEYDHQGKGAGWTRNQAMKSASSEYIAFLDDDDRWMDNHLDVLMGGIEEYGSDLVYSHNNNPSKLPKGIRRHFTQEQDMDMTAEMIIEDSFFVPVAFVVRRELALEVKFPVPKNLDQRNCEELGFQKRLARLGATFKHIPKKTWFYSHEPHNHTSGMGWKYVYGKA